VGKLQQSAAGEGSSSSSATIEQGLQVGCMLLNYDCTVYVLHYILGAESMRHCSPRLTLCTLGHHCVDACCMQLGHSNFTPTYASSLACIRIFCTHHHMPIELDPSVSLQDHNCQLATSWHCGTAKRWQGVQGLRAWQLQPEIADYVT
jgi:hypothetical protein